MTAYEAGQTTKNELLKQKAALQGAIHMSYKKLEEVKHSIHKVESHENREKVANTLKNVGKGAKTVRKTGLSSLGKLAGFASKITKTVVDDFKEGYKEGMNQ